MVAHNTDIEIDSPNTASEIAQQQQPAPRPPPRTGRSVIAFFAAMAVGGVGLAAIGLVPRAGADAELAAGTQAVADARRTVTAVSAARNAQSYELRLPGSTAPLQSTVLYARTDGYLKAFHVDIGDRVKAGQLLAEIESPETNDQLREARATLEQNRANLDLAAQRLDRVKGLYQERAAGRGELDDLTALYNSAVAAVRVSEAVVSRLETEVSFQKVTAPFDGIVTQRNVELGSLVTAGSASSVAPLFRVEQNDTLRVYVDVPQSAAPSVSVGQPVQIELREFPGQRFDGRVARTAGSVDAATRTLRTEIHVPNPGGRLFSGAYAQVLLGVNDPRNPLRVPAAALVIDATGPQVVVVSPAGTISRQVVTLGRDFGKDVEVTAGLTGDEKLVANPRDDLRDGESVRVQ